MLRADSDLHHQHTAIAMGGGGATKIGAVSHCVCVHMQCNSTWAQLAAHSRYMTYLRIAAATWLQLLHAPAPPTMAGRNLLCCCSRPAAGAPPPPTISAAAGAAAALPSSSCLLFLAHYWIEHRHWVHAWRCQCPGWRRQLSAGHCAAAALSCKCTCGAYDDSGGVVAVCDRF